MVTPAACPEICRLRPLPTMLDRWIDCRHLSGLCTCFHPNIGESTFGAFEFESTPDAPLQVIFWLAGAV